MRPLSATEAISPAIQRARDVLGRPFRWGTFFKLAAVAFFAQMGGSFNFNFPGRGSGLHGLPPAVLAFLVAFSVILGLIALVLGLVLFYVGSRLQLVLVELVATRQSYVAPVWRRCGAPTWRWIGLKVLYFLVVVGTMLLVTAPAIVYFVRHRQSLRALGSGGFSGLHFFPILMVIVAAFFVIMAISASYMLLRDLALPFLALEDLSISETLRRLRLLLAAEPGEVVVFLLLKLLLLFVFAIGGEIAIGIILLISLIPFGVAGGGLWLMLHHSGAAGTAILIAGAGLGILILVCWMLCVGISILGSIYTFSQAYALYFLGGRFPLLGDLLDRSTPPPSYAYAGGFPPQAYPPQAYPPQTGPTQTGPQSPTG